VGHYLAGCITSSAEARAVLEGGEILFLSRVCEPHRAVRGGGGVMKILLALDDSKCSAGATDALIAHTKTENTEICVLHALEAFPVSLARKIGSRESPDFVGARLKLRERGRKLLARAAEKLRPAGCKVTFSVEEGDPREVILNRAERWHADLIIVGSHGRKGLDRFLIGSVSEAVARHARCSVEIVRTRSAR
jgi:nucleotide-binding universal stress UspA family protein